MNGQSTQTTSPTVFRKLADPLREVGQKLTQTLKSLHLTEEERERAGIQLGRDSSNYEEKGRFFIEGGN